FTSGAGTAHGWYRIGGVVPGGVEAERGVRARRQRPVVAQVAHGDRRSGRRQRAVPELADGLPVGEGPPHGPTGDGSGPRGDREAALEASRELVHDGVGRRARTRGRGRGGGGRGGPRRRRS